MFCSDIHRWVWLTLVRQIDEFERAVVRIEANAVDDPPHLPHREQAYRDHDEPADFAHETDAKPGTTVQVLPPKPAPPLYAGLTPNQRADNFHLARLAEEFVRHVRFASKIDRSCAPRNGDHRDVFIAILWPSHKVSPPIAVANKFPQNGETGVRMTAPMRRHLHRQITLRRWRFPLPNSFGIYVLSNNQLTELEPLPISIPDARIALSAEIDRPSATTISDERPAFHSLPTRSSKQCASKDYVARDRSHGAGNEDRWWKSRDDRYRRSMADSKHFS